MTFCSCPVIIPFCIRKAEPFFLFTFFSFFFQKTLFPKKTMFSSSKSFSDFFTQPLKKRKEKRNSESRKRKDKITSPSPPNFFPLFLILCYLKYHSVLGGGGGYVMFRYFFFFFQNRTSLFFLVLASLFTVFVCLRIIYRTI